MAKYYSLLARTNPALLSEIARKGAAARVAKCDTAAIAAHARAARAAKFLARHADCGTRRDWTAEAIATHPWATCPTGKAVRAALAAHVARRSAKAAQES